MSKDTEEYQEADYYIRNSEDFRWLVLSYGFIGGRKDGNIITISRCYVNENCREQGYGKELVQSYERLFEEGQVIRIKSKPEAVKFWEKQGYTISNEEGGYYEGYKTL